MFVLEYFGSQINHKFYTFLNICVVFFLKNLHICENGRLCETKNGGKFCILNK